MVAQLLMTPVMVSPLVMAATMPPQDRALALAPPNRVSQEQMLPGKTLTELALASAARPLTEPTGAPLSSGPVTSASPTISAPAASTGSSATTASSVASLEAALAALPAAQPTSQTPPRPSLASLITGPQQAGGSLSAYTPAPAYTPPRPTFQPPAQPAAPPPERLNPKNIFENFVVGPSNQLAHAAAQAAAGSGGRRYNPLFLCGGTGLGKTHLMQAIAHKVLSERPDKRILYISAEHFTNDFITAIQNKRMDAFRSHYRSECDLLLVDDIQFLAGREQTQEEFFHTFNALHEFDRPIVFTSDKYPQQLERMEERLISRFSWGLVADIQVPELETRVAIVRKKAEVECIQLDDSVAVYLAQTINANVRELEGTLIRLAAKSSLMQQSVDMAFAQAELSAVNPNRASRLTSVDDIQRAVCHHFQLRSSDLLSKDRHKTTAFARHVAMYLCKQRLNISFPELGRAFGKDHTTVMSAVRKVETMREQDPQVRAHLEAIEKRLSNGA
jgi:chromosomal replication initiator protein